MKRRNRKYKIKEYVQSLIYLLEISTFIFLILGLFAKLEQGEFFYWLKDMRSFEFLSKITIAFAFYQLLAYAFVKLKLAAREDDILSIHSLVAYAIHYNEYHMSLEDIKNRCELFLDGKSNYMLNNEDIERINKINRLTELLSQRNITETEYRFYMKKLKIDFEHDSEYNSLTWKNSFLLNKFK